ncbi:MAG: hypothetical protein BA863_03225 [Desulfovibrio sp. S3730MH75]|nr:MAG: hypothetical protein BA863_03225 [Desulfovibrio sp. S3730MH75]
MTTYIYSNTELEERYCPHCKEELSPWIAPPESGWSVLMVCNNNDCSFYNGSDADIINKRDDSCLGCRYAENPDNNYSSFNLLAWCK